MSKRELKQRLDELFSTQAESPQAEPPAPVAPDRPPERTDERLRLQAIALESAADGIVIADRDGNTLWVNPAFTRTTGYAAEDVIGRNLRVLKSGQHDRAFYENLWNTILSGQVWSGEVINRRKDGGLYHENQIITPVRDERGEIAYFVSTKQDITARKQAEDNITRRNRELAILNQASRQLSELTKPAEIHELMYAFVGRLIDNRNFYIALHNEARQEISFPIYTLDGERREVASRPFADGLTEHLIRTKAPILFPRNVEAELEQLGIVSIGRKAQCWMGVPMVVGDKAIGVVALQDYDREAVYTEEHVELLATLAAQAATAIENARLFEDARTRAEEMAALNDLSRALAARLSVDQVLDEVYRGLSRLIDTTNFYIALYDAARHEMSFLINVTESVIEKQIVTLSADRGITGWIIRARESVLIQDDVTRWLEAHGIEHVGDYAQSWLGVPMMIGDQMLGVMAVQDYKTRFAYDERDRDMLAAIASQAAVALQNARLFEESRRRIDELAILNEIGREFSSALSLDELFRVIHRQVGRVLDAGNFFIATYEEGDPEWTMAFHVEGGQPMETGPHPTGLGFTSHVLLTRQPLMLRSLQESKSFSSAFTSQRSGQQCRSWMGVPFIAAGHVVGAMVIQDYERDGVYDDQDFVLFSTIASQAAIALQNARLFEQTRRQVEELATVNRLAQFLSAQMDIPSLAAVLVNELRQAVGAPDGYLALYNAQTQMIEIPYLAEGDQSVSVEPFPIGTGLTSLIIERRQPLLINRDTVRRTVELGAKLVGEPARSYLGAPIMVRDEVLGVIAIQSREQEGLFSEFEQRLLSTIAPSVGIAIQNARLFQQARARAAELAVFNEIARSVSQQLDLSQALEATYQYAQRLLPLDAFIVGLYDEASNTVQYPLVYDEGRRYEESPRPLRPGSYIARVIQEGEPLLHLLSVEELAETDQRPSLGNVSRTPAAVIYVPLRLGDRIIGAMSAQSYQVGVYHHDHVELFSQMANQVVAAIQNARLFEQTQTRARREELINRISGKIRASVSVDDVLRIAVDELRQATHTTRAVVQLNLMGESGNGQAGAGSESKAKA